MTETTTERNEIARVSHEQNGSSYYSFDSISGVLRLNKERWHIELMESLTLRLIASPSGITVRLNIEDTVTELNNVRCISYVPNEMIFNPCLSQRLKEYFHMSSDY
jgi:hypothetical protein